jgi:hypothetical protein
MANDEKDTTAPTPVKAPTPDFMAAACPRGEVFMLLDAAANPLHDKLDHITENLKFLPYQAICISLIIEKLGITDAEIDAHREKVQAELAAGEAADKLEQAIAQQVIDDAHGGAKA